MHRRIQLCFDFQLHRIGKLHAAFGKKLNAVIGIHIVRGGNHHPAIQAQGPGKVGHARRGQGAGEQYIHPGGGKARFHRCFEHIAGNARVFANQNRRAVIKTVLHQHLPGGIGQFHHKFRGNRVLPYFAAHAIGAEIFFAHFASLKYA